MEITGLFFFERSEFLIQPKLLRSIGLHTEKNVCVCVPFNLVLEYITWFYFILDFCDADRENSETAGHETKGMKP